MSGYNITLGMSYSETVYDFVRELPPIENRKTHFHRGLITVCSRVNSIHLRQKKQWGAGARRPVAYHPHEPQPILIHHIKTNVFSLMGTNAFSAAVVLSTSKIILSFCQSPKPLPIDPSAYETGLTQAQAFQTENLPAKNHCSNLHKPPDAAL